MTVTKKPIQAGLDRRTLLRGGLLALGSIGGGALRSLSADAPIEVPAYPTKSAAVGKLGKFGRTAEAGQVDVGGGATYHSWFLDGAYPAPEIRVREGETMQVVLDNQLPPASPSGTHKTRNRRPRYPTFCRPAGSAPAPGSCRPPFPI